MRLADHLANGRIILPAVCMTLHGFIPRPDAVLLEGQGKCTVGAHAPDARRRNRGDTVRGRAKGRGITGLHKAGDASGAEGRDTLSGGEALPLHNVRGGAP